MSIKVGINGFGRIGRNVVRAALHNPEHRIRRRQRSDRHQDAGAPAEVRFDSRHAARRCAAWKANSIVVGGKRIKIFAIEGSGGDRLFRASARRS